MQKLGDALADLIARGELRLPPTLEPSAASTAVDDPEPVVCPRCRGARFLRRDVDLSDPLFGKSFRCDCPDAISFAQRAAGLFWPDDAPRPGGLWAKTLRRFTERDGTESAAMAAMEWAESPDGWLILLGPPGTGKSHLLAALTNRLIEHRLAPRYWPSIRVLGWLREGFGDGADPPYSTRLQELVGCPYLLLDDLGSETITAWVAERWQEILDGRYAARLPTVIASNLTLDQIEDKLGLRIASRLKDARLCKVRGLSADDYRPLLGADDDGDVL